MNKNLYSYIHIPFCDQKCGYCRFASIGSTQKFQISKYVHSLVDEVRTSPLTPLLQERGIGVFVPPSPVGEGIQGGGYLKSIYFGGGTPSVLELSQIKMILDTMESKYCFDPDIEITLETTPINVTKENLQNWKKLGINRISMGVQTLSTKSLDEIGRGNKGDIIQALDLLQERGIDNISLDFIIGLPYVEKGEIKKDIEYILDAYSFIKHISVYLLEEYYNEDKIIETKYDKVTYPDDWNKLGIKDEDYLAEYREIKKFLKSRGFHSYEISNFSQPGYECKHNQAYWNHSQIVAFGLGAYGYTNGVRYRNSDSFNEYYKREKKVQELSNSEDLFLEKIMFQLRTSGIEQSLYSQLDTNKINLFIKDGYLKEENSVIKLEDKGVLVMDYILKEII